MNVFIVDPNAERRNRLLSILAQRGHDVSGFADGDAALAAQLRHNGRAWIEAKYDWRTTYRAWDEVYG